MQSAPEQQIAALAKALHAAAEEHGLPNAFMPGELAYFYGGPPAMAAGRIGNMWLDRLAAALPGTVVTYGHRKFQLS